MANDALKSTKGGERQLKVWDKQPVGSCQNKLVQITRLAEPQSCICGPKDAEHYMISIILQRFVLGCVI